MGDRANIVVRDRWPDDLGDKEAVFLYTHWNGYELPETLRVGLSAARGRWTDESYLARVLFQTMIGDDQEITGFGISSRLTDNQYDLLVLREERVYLLTESDYRDVGFTSLEQAPSLSFDEVCDHDAEMMTWEILEALAKKEVQA